MRTINRDSLPYLVSLFSERIKRNFFTTCAYVAAIWWKIDLGEGCSFLGLPQFVRHPGSYIGIGTCCRFNSSYNANLIGVNRPCMISTLADRARITIGEGCGFSGTVIACAQKIILGRNVRCGANTLIMDTDWHWNDPRTGPNAPVEIGDNVWLGINVTVTKGVTIGENTLVAAGSIVTKSLPANVIAGGIPARVVRSIDVDRTPKTEPLSI